MSNLDKELEQLCSKLGVTNPKTVSISQVSNNFSKKGMGLQDSFSARYMLHLVRSITKIEHAIKVNEEKVLRHEENIVNNRRILLNSSTELRERDKNEFLKDFQELKDLYVPFFNDKLALKILQEEILRHHDEIAPEIKSDNRSTLATLLIEAIRNKHRAKRLKAKDRLSLSRRIQRLVKTNNSLKKLFVKDTLNKHKSIPERQLYQQQQGFFLKNVEELTVLRYPKETDDTKKPCNDFYKSFVTQLTKSVNMHIVSDNQKNREPTYNTGTDKRQKI